MADEKEEKPIGFITRELRILTEGSAEKLYVKDKNDKEHTLTPLTIRDLIEFERRAGGDVFKIMNANLGIENIFHLLYLSLRKEGCSPEDIKRGKYTHSEVDVQEMFDLAILKSSIVVFSHLLRISGFGKVKEDQKALGNPSDPQSPQASADAQNSKATMPVG
jgi:hypothetical protein